MVLWMKKFILLSLFICVWVVLASGQSNFIYLRYDVPTDNIYAIVEKIEKIYNQSDECVLYHMGSIYKGDKVKGHINSKGFLLDVDENRSKEDVALLNGAFVDMFDEIVSEQGSSYFLYGKNDSSWTLTFIMSEETSFVDICRLIGANDIEGRNLDLRFWLYNDMAAFKTLGCRQMLDMNKKNMFVIF